MNKLLGTKNQQTNKKGKQTSSFDIFPIVDR